MDLLKRNEGTVDRVVRIAVGVGLLSIVFFGPKTLWGLIGIIPLATGLLGTCPLYSIFGLSTCPVSPHKTT
jgi:hypothetical protein